MKSLIVTLLICSATMLALDGGHTDFSKELFCDRALLRMADPCAWADYSLPAPTGQSRSLDRPARIYGHAGVPLWKCSPP